MPAQAWVLIGVRIDITCSKYFPSYLAKRVSTRDRCGLHNDLQTNHTLQRLLQDPSISCRSWRGSRLWCRLWLVLGWFLHVRAWPRTSALIGGKQITVKTGYIHCIFRSNELHFGRSSTVLWLKEQASLIISKSRVRLMWTYIYVYVFI